MRISFLLFFLTGILFRTQAQEDAPDPRFTHSDTDYIPNEIDLLTANTVPDSIRVYIYCEQDASFPGGDTALSSFIRKNLQYPEDARTKGIEGFTYVMFIVEKDGTLSHIMLVRGRELSPSLDQSALDIINKSPRWIPAKSNGTIVRSKKIVRIAFNKQTNAFVYEATDSIHVTTPPQFPGGDKAFGKFLASHLIYPPGAVAGGTTYIQFIIEKDGSLSNIKVVEGKGLNQPCDEEAIRVLSSSPKWTPGMKNGSPVRTRKIQRVTFGSARNQKKNTY